LPGPPQGLLAAPAGDLAGVAGAQYLGHSPAAELLRPGIVGTFQQSICKAVALGSMLIAQNARDVAGQGVDHDKRRQFSTGQDIIADRDLVINEALAHALIDPFVTTTDE